MMHPKEFKTRSYHQQRQLLHHCQPWLSRNCSSPPVMRESSSLQNHSTYWPKHHQIVTLTEDPARTKVTFQHQWKWHFHLVPHKLRSERNASLHFTMETPLTKPPNSACTGETTCQWGPTDRMWASTEQLDINPNFQRTVCQGQRSKLQTPPETIRQIQNGRRSARNWPGHFRK